METWKISVLFFWFFEGFAYQKKFILLVFGVAVIESSILTLLVVTFPVSNYDFTKKESG